LNKSRTGRHFEDFTLGMRMVHPTPRTLGEGDRSLYIALTGSRNVLATAQTNSSRLGLASWPLEDMLVFNVAFGKTVPDLSQNAIANLGYAELRFSDFVHPGDTLAVSSDVIGLHENSNGRSGVVYVRSNATNQHGKDVLSWVRWVMVKKRSPGSPSTRSSVPVLAPRVTQDALAATRFGDGIAAVREMTGFDDLWDDYEVGERIDHPGGMTVNDSDHSLATRLYQNTANAHFDGHAMGQTQGGLRLVYGGHVMSLCRALAYDGLENVLCMLAVNAGTHVNPTHAGDTLYCATQVVEKLDLGSAIGALRLRMIAAKNVSGAASIVFAQPRDGRVSHASSVVLDLDYTVAIPKH
jgi:2-methylfumaryl-CoA hydratase